MRRMMFAVVPLAFVLTASAGYRPSCEKEPEQVMLVEEGVAKCRVVVSEAASKPEKLGATELAKYFTRATGCGELNGAYPIVLDCRERKDGLDPWKEDEFEIEVTEAGAMITGNGPRGTLYGVYEILKEYAGMRWLVPGDDGEYCVHVGRTIALPVGKVKKKPYLKIRETRTTADEGALWTVRNNMQSQGLGLQLFSDGKGRRTKDCDRLEALCEKGVGPCGHIQSMLLITDLADKNPPKDAKVRAEAMFAKHPEWFPVVDGERKVIWSANDPNPCVSNEAYLDHAAEVICRLIDRPHGRDAFMTLGNNDTTLWCQCEKCKTLDAPEAKGTKGEMSDRYWHMVNGIAKRVWKRFPDAKFCGWGYQNYWYPPVKTKIDPRLKVFISFNNQCWRHHCLDPKCTVNAEMRKIYSLWAKTGLPLVVNRDEISSSGPGSDFLPSESILWQNFRDYMEMGCSGSHFCVSGPYPRFVDREKNKPPYYGANDEWYAMWQTCYLSARAEWDNTRDYEKEWEEANTLYYGKTAWEGAMREFRRTLEKAFFETPGCMGWGSGAPLGRCLDQAGMEQKLKELLEKAAALAKTDPDPRALKHVEMEKSIFERTWLKARQVYLDNFKELNVYRRKEKITVDGDLDEADWKDADVLSNFKASPWSKVATPDIQQTFVRVTYDSDFLYIAVEAMEPEIAKMKAGKTVDRQHGYKQLGNHLELFYSFPDMAEGCYQLMVNSEGQMYDLKRKSVADSDSSFLTNAKWAVKKGADRWTLEIAIPCTEIGQNCFDGATWRLNVARQREVEGAKRESSSCCNGRFYAPATFVNMKFTPGRAKGIGQSNDMAPWKNAGFEAFRPNPTDRRFTWTKWTSPNVPKGWSDGSCATPGELVEEDGNRYLRIHGSPETDIFQYFLGNGKGSLHTTFRARGTGRLTFWTCSYTNFPPAAQRGGYCAVDGTSKSNTFDLTAEWKTYSFDTPKLGYPTERVAHRIRMRGEGCTADIDDVYITPHFEAEAESAASPRVVRLADWRFSKDGGDFGCVAVPHDWAIAGPFDPGAPGGTGKLPWIADGEYRTTFTLDSMPAHARLEFDGVMAWPEVFVNGQKVGGWDFGYMSFDCDITGAVRPGANEVVVKASTRAHKSRWYPGGGIYREVRLVTEARDHVMPGSVFIRSALQADGSAVVTAEWTMSETGPQKRKTTIAEPRLWSVEEPNLYTMEIAGHTYRYGIRTIEWTADDGFHLNGQRVQLQGVNLHSDLGPLGMAFDRDAAKRQLLLMKDMGVNAVRTSHNAPDPKFLDLCDEMGFLVWDECFDKWNETAGRKGDQNLEEFVVRNLRQLVRRDRNHPCVICWSVSNEIAPVGSKYGDANGQTRARNRLFRETVRALDPTRPVAAGLASPDLLKGDAIDDLDVQGWNYEHSYAAARAKYPAVPFVYSESASAVSNYGYYNPQTRGKDDFSAETMQADGYDLTSAWCGDIPDVEFDRVDRDRYLAGEFVWTGIDYLGEPCPFTYIGRPDCWPGPSVPETAKPRSSYFGIADLCSIPKDRYYLYRSRWNKKSETTHIVPQHWNFSSSEASGPRPLVPVFVYTRGDGAELFLNGRSLGRRAKAEAVDYPLDFAGRNPPRGDYASNDYYRVCAKYRLRWADVPWEPGELKAVAYRGGRKIGEDAVRTAGEPVALKLSEDPFTPDGSRLAFVQVDVVDAKGVRHPLDTRTVRFRTEGDAEILAVGNGDPMSFKSFKETSAHPLYYGKAVVYVRRGASDAKLVAEADGVRSASFDIAHKSETEESK